MNIPERYVLAFLILGHLSLLITSCGGDESSIDCEELFAADTTVQRFIRQLEDAIAAGDCQSAGPIYTVLNLTAQPYEGCEPARQELSKLEEAYKNLLMNCEVDTTVDSFRATISGAVSSDFEAENLAAGEPLILVSSDSISLSLIANDIIGLTTTTHQIAFNLTNYFGSGSYTFGLATGNTAIFSQTFIDPLNPTEPDVIPYAALSGSVEIMETESNISGVFSFTAVNQSLQTVNVSDGYFLVDQ